MNTHSAFNMVIHEPHFNPSALFDVLRTQAFVSYYANLETKCKVSSCLETVSHSVHESKHS
jgi:hypothetical protein